MRVLCGFLGGLGLKGSVSEIYGLLWGFRGLGLSCRVYEGFMGLMGVYGVSFGCIVSSLQA